MLIRLIILYLIEFASLDHAVVDSDGMMTFIMNRLDTRPARGDLHWL